MGWSRLRRRTTPVLHHVAAEYRYAALSHTRDHAPQREPMSRLRRHPLVELGAQVTQITLDAGGVTEDEAGQRAENHVIDLAIFGDPDFRAAGRRRDFERPRAAERQALAGDPRHQPFRRPGFHQLISDFLPVGILFPPALVS